LRRVVGKDVTSRLSGPVPMPQTNFVPPASIPPNRFILGHTLWTRVYRLAKGRRHCSELPLLNPWQCAFEP
jgi:hypothetical protein